LYFYTARTNIKNPNRKSMKSLFINRHAKSSWKYGNLNDFDRPLNSRGILAAQFMAKKLKEKGEEFDLIISSPANRAFSTAEVFAEEFNYEHSLIEEAHSVYLSDHGTLLTIIDNLPDAFNKIMIFGHNPGFTNLANVLTGGNLGNIPTCGIIKIDFEVDSWQHVIPGSGTMAFFDYPKRYKEMQLLVED
jgi:phosphohistidine phosphatase